MAWSAMTLRRHTQTRSSAFPTRRAPRRSPHREQTRRPLRGLPLNHHWTKNIIASNDGTKLYATVGSTATSRENGFRVGRGRAAIWEIDRATGRSRIFASGLRNPNGLAWEPRTGALWTTVNERDELGDDLVPDYMTLSATADIRLAVQIFRRHVDRRGEDAASRSGRERNARIMLGRAHSIAGLVFYEDTALAARYRGGAFTRTARFVEPTRPDGLQGHLRARSRNGRPSGRRKMG